MGLVARVTAWVRHGSGRLGDAGRGSSRYEGHDIEMGMKGHMPSRQLGTLESNDMGGRDRQWTTASAGQSQRGGKFTSTHLVALRASCFPRRGWQAQAHTCTERAHQQCLEGTRRAGFGRGLGRLDDIPSAANSTEAVRRLQRRASTRRPFLDSRPGGPRKVVAELPCF